MFQLSNIFIDRNLFKYISNDSIDKNFNLIVSNKKLNLLLKNYFSKKIVYKVSFKILKVL